MKSMRASSVRTPHRPGPLAAGITLAAVVLLTTAVADREREDRDRHGQTCRETAGLALSAAHNEAAADYWLELAKASTLPDGDERHEARKDAVAEYKARRALAKAQYRARVDLCARLDETRYHPAIEPEAFLSPTEAAAAPNPSLPLIPGRTMKYQGVSDEGTETIQVTVTHDTREILGVTCVVVVDTAWLDGELVEDTRDWLAQDREGNVWYFGERSVEYEDGAIDSLSGSWEAGVDGAKPGILMLAAPESGRAYRQEFALGEAEDAAEVVALDASVTVPFGTYSGCLQTREFTPLSPEASEFKYYAPGVGLVLEANPESGTRVELIAIETE